MKILQLWITLASLVAVVGCGSTDKPDASGERARGDASVEAKHALPSAGIIRVPVAADGTELTEQADFRLVNGEAPSDSANDVDMAFAAGTPPVHVRDELDRDGSTQSWSNWRGGRYGPTLGGYDSHYYSTWRPSCNNYGYNYYYGRPSYYSFIGYNYYLYPYYY